MNVLKVLHFLTPLDISLAHPEKFLFARLNIHLIHTITVALIIPIVLCLHNLMQDR